jgi:hypothetical protein
MNPALEAAIRYAVEWEWPAFFVSASKRPFRGSHGFLDASLDPAAITDLWRPDACLALAVPDGFVVVDVDPGADPSQISLLRTREQHTPRGGRHLVYRTHREVRPSVGRWPRIDLRGPGSYILVEPSPGYWWTNHGSVRDAPQWVYQPRQPQQPQRIAPIGENSTPTLVQSRVIAGGARATLSIF